MSKKFSSSPRFTRRREDFICLHCGKRVKGNGYTNHCPGCVWSRHVDVNPGDRAADCQGMMQPVGIRIQKGEYDIQHRCLECGKMMFCKVSPEDDFEMILKISKEEVHSFLSNHKKDFGGGGTR